MGGIELDPTGLYHAGARTYHPTLQRFLSEDPTGYGGGDINLFAYAGSDPVDGSDPSGLDACPDGDCGGGDPNSFGGIPDIFELFFLGGGSSSGPAQWDTFTHLWEKAQLAGTLQSLGVAVSGGPVLLAQADEKETSPREELELPEPIASIQGRPARMPMNDFEQTAMRV